MYIRKVAHVLFVFLLMFSLHLANALESQYID